ncbi:hypothetical protein LPJ61_002232 [Coemansia biformis]|uniref:Calcium-dependent phosphotriesterase n=1 Tax=Coemansia biformis TaxID=1286918 RepID=A0A9W7YEH0_9FUNG|nr:hypothetical protein LPJ61_002232 [Coemansia biformis]
MASPTYRRQVCLAAAAAAFAALYMYVAHSLAIIGFGKTYASVNATSCRQVGRGMLQGCEDIVVDPHTGLAYLACGNLAARQRWIFPNEAHDASLHAGADHVYVMDERDAVADIRLLEPAADGGLVPFSQTIRLHGFDIYWEPKDPRRMTFMFVNHQLDRAAVSIFSHTSGADHMVHEETVWSELLWSPNNIVAMSKHSFYATNDMKYNHGVLRELSSTLRLPGGHVVYRNDLGAFSIAASHIRFPNGIAKYRDWIYVVASGDPGVHIYQAGAAGRLEYTGRVVYSDSVPDNIFVDPANGQIYSASFLKVLEMYKYFKHPSLATTQAAGTKVVRLTQRSNPSHGFDIESLLIDSGELMPTATIAALQRRNQVKRLLIGCVMCDSVSVCDAVA